MNFEVEYIEKLAKLIDEKSLSEIVLEDGEQAITIKREINALFLKYTDQLLKPNYSCMLPTIYRNRSHGERTTA